MCWQVAPRWESESIAVPVLWWGPFPSSVQEPGAGSWGTLAPALGWEACQGVCHQRTGKRAMGAGEHPSFLTSLYLKVRMV